MFRTVIALIYPTARKIVDFFRSWNDCMVSLVSKSLIWLVLGYTSCWFTPVDYEFTNGILSLILTNWIWLAGNSFAEQMLSSLNFLLEWFSSSFLLRHWHYMVSSLASSSLPVLANPGLTNKLSSWMWYTATDCECYCGVRVGNVSTQTAALACSCDSIYVRIIKLRLSRKRVSRTFLSHSLFLVICSNPN